MLETARRTPLLEANVASSLAGLEAMLGNTEAARDRCLDAAAIFEELGLRLPLAGLSQIAGMVELLAGDGPAAETWLRRGLDVLGSAASSGLHLSLLAHSLYHQERLDEAEELRATLRSKERRTSKSSGGQRRRCSRPGRARRAVRSRSRGRPFA